MFARGWLRIAALAALALPPSACSSDRSTAFVDSRFSDGGGPDGDAGKVYAMTFTCQADAGADCPSGQPCPEVPLSSTACGDLPAILGHEAIHQPTGHPVGCRAGLPYGNPWYVDMQVICTCFADGIESGTAAGWACAI